MVAIAVGVILLAVATFLSLAFGARITSLSEVMEALRGTAETPGAVAVQERFPRTAAAALTGAALGMSGALMQAVTRNPIADPGILGVNPAASLAVVFGIVFLNTTSLPVMMALAATGGIIAAIFVYLIGSLGPGGTTPIKLALAGVAVGAVATSLTTAIYMPMAQNLDAFRFWQVGSLGRVEFSGLATAGSVLVFAGIVGWLFARPLNLIALGDETAKGLGVKVGAVRLGAGMSGVVLAAVSTALIGPITFMGLMVPHVVRMLTGPNQLRVIPLSAIYGASLLMLADTLGRVIARPSEVAVGVVVAFLGAPILITIARRAKVREL